MNETVSNKTQVTEFDKLLAESINKSNLKEGTRGSWGSGIWSYRNRLVTSVNSVRTYLRRTD